MLPDRLLIDARWYVAEDTIRPSAPQRATEPYELLKRLCTEYGVNCHRAYRAVAEGRLDAPLPHGTTRGRRCRRSEFVRWMEEDLMERRA